MTREQTARAFAQRKKAACHNAMTDGNTYLLHGNKIAEVIAPGILRTNWCGWRTMTTQSHLNDVLEAFGIPVRLARKDPNETQDWSFK